MIHKIPFNKIPLLSQTALDFLYKPEKISEFIEEISVIENFEKVIANRKDVNRNVLVDELKKQNSNSHKNSKKNIELLLDNNTFTVTTGHQVCLFTGPLYSIYKIISTLNLAKKLKENYPDKNFVPVFWMATEDHDFEEINHIHLFGKTHIWETSQKGPVGRFSTKEMQPFLSELKEIIGSDLSKEAIGYYENSTTIAEAHNKLINHLFGEFGVVVLDADSKELKKEMIPVFKNELLNQQTFEVVEKQSEKLVSKGYKKQVTPREINLFYQEKGLRERIVFEDEQYKVLNTKLEFSETEILAKLTNYPEKFSPNVVMRPIYQEKILPNLAYIGGPGELAYWLQLKSGFELHNIDFPMLILRNSALLIKSNIKRKIDDLPFELFDYFQDNDELIKRYIDKVSEVDFEEEITEIEKIFELTKEKVGEIDFTLEKTVVAELKRAQNSFNKIQKKVVKAEKTNHSIALNRIEAVKDAFFPSNSFQERYDNILEYHEEYLIKNLINNLKSLEDNLTLMELK